MKTACFGKRSDLFLCRWGKIWTGTVYAFYVLQDLILSCSEQYCPQSLSLVQAEPRMSGSKARYRSRSRKELWLVCRFRAHCAEGTWPSWTCSCPPHRQESCQDSWQIPQAAQNSHLGVMPGQEERSISLTLPWLSSCLLLFCQVSQSSRRVNNK